jgi:glutathione-independent formaldehyde dehydrogenase
MARVTPGKSVAVLGGGPVGLLAAYSSVLKGAGEVYVIDRIPERLEKAKELGATPVDFLKGDPVEQIFQLRKKNKGIQGSLRPGEEKLEGVDCVVDAVGYQAQPDQEAKPSQEKPTQPLENAVRLVNPTGSIGVVGVYIAPDPGGRTEQEKQGFYPIPLAEMFEKGITIGFGQTPVKRYNEYLRDMIVAGRAKPSKIVSHRIRIEEAPDAYDKFRQRTQGYAKVLIKFGKLAA